MWFSWCVFIDSEFMNIVVQCTPIYLTVACSIKLFLSILLNTCYILDLHTSLCPIIVTYVHHYIYMHESNFHKIVGDIIVLFIH